MAAAAWGPKFYTELFDWKIDEPVPPPITG
jgi:hypothetical protein